MKTKGVGLIEEHIEKLVLGIALIVFLSVLSLQFLSQPNQVTIGTETVSPDQAFKPVERKAEAVLAEVNRQEVSDSVLERFTPVDLVDQYQALKQKSAVPSRVLATTMGKPLELEVGTQMTGPVGDRLYTQVVIPAPAGTVAASTHSTIDPYEVMAVPGLKEVISTGQPFDKASVSVEVVYDGIALRTAFEYEPNDGTTMRIPLSWWRGSVAILGLQLERQRWSEIDQQWTELELLPAAPGQLDLLSELSENYGEQGPGLPVVLEMVDEVQEPSVEAEVFRPGYYRTIAGPDWLPPAQTAMRYGDNETQRQIGRKIAQLDAARDRLDGLNVKLEEAGGQARDPRPRQNPAGRGGGKTGGGREPGRPQSSGNDRSGGQVATIERQIDKVLSQIDRLTEQLMTDYSIEFDEEGNRVEPDLDEIVTRQSPMLEDDQIRMWAHDMAAEPGARYRYHLRVAVNNPYYMRQRLLTEEQASLASEPILFSDWSEWSEPVDIERDQHYFVVGARESDGLGMGSGASVRLYRFFYGYWREARSTLRVGDALKGQTDPLPEGLFLIDEKYLTDASLGQRAPSPISRDRDAGRLGEQAGGGLARESAQEKPEPEEGQIAVPEQLEIGIDAFLLDVAKSPVEISSAGRKAGVFQVFFKGLGGQVVVRSPNLDTSTALYDRVRSSAVLGRTQGEPVPEPEKPEKIIPKQERPPEEPGRGDGGGGGGGGGG